jgi:ribosome-binding factor A
MSLRSERVASVIKEEVSTLFQRNFSMEEYGFLTVTDVEMSPDLKNAKIYVSVFGDAARKERSLALLDEQKGFVRSTLGRALRLKFTPVITFELDETLDRALKIERIISEIHKDEKGTKDS